MGSREVLNVAGGDVEDTPDYGPGAATPYILGMAKVKGKVRILLEIDQVLKQPGPAGIGRIIHERRRHRALRAVQTAVDFSPPPAGGRPRLRE